MTRFKRLCGVCFTAIFILGIFSSCQTSSLDSVPAQENGPTPEEYEVVKAALSGLVDDWQHGPDSKPNFAFECYVSDQLEKPYMLHRFKPEENGVPHDFTAALDALVQKQLEGKIHAEVVPATCKSTSNISAATPSRRMRSRPVSMVRVACSRAGIDNQKRYAVLLVMEFWRPIYTHGKNIQRGGEWNLLLLRNDGGVWKLIKKVLVSAQ